MAFFMLIVHSDHNRAILETFKAKFGRSKVISSCRGDFERGKKWQFLSQNRIFCRFYPPHWIFHANFAPWLQQGNTGDFLSQVWKVKIISPRGGGPWKWPNIRLRLRNCHFWPISESLPRGEIIFTFQTWLKKSPVLPCYSQGEKVA